VGHLKKTLRKVSRVFASRAVLFMLLVFAAFPILVLVFNSLKTRTDLAQNPMGFPSDPQFGNYATAFNESNFLLHATNSGILVAGTVALILTFGGMAAYSLARLELPGSTVVMAYMISLTAFPVWLYLVPLFFQMRSVGLIDTHVGLIIIYTAINSPLAIFLLRSFLVQIPKELEESAQLDGAGRWVILLRIILPISWTGFLTIALVVAVAVWGEFQIAFVLLQSGDKYPITMSFLSFAESYGRDWTLTSAVGVLAIVPIVTLFVIFQRRFAEGLTQGSVK
jgi:raffinose/stachyose/melibiose transport system permease protein